MKIVGIQQMKGVSKKTGKPYDSVVLYVTGEAKDVVGCITDNIWVPRDVWDSQVGEPVSDAFIGMDVYLGLLVMMFWVPCFRLGMMIGVLMFAVLRNCRQHVGSRKKSFLSRSPVSSFRF